MAINSRAHLSTPGLTLDYLNYLVTEGNLWSFHVEFTSAKKIIVSNESLKDTLWMTSLFITNNGTTPITFKPYNSSAYMSLSGFTEIGYEEANGYGGVFNKLLEVTPPAGYTFPGYVYHTTNAVEAGSIPLYTKHIPASGGYKTAYNISGITGVLPGKFVVLDITATAQWNIDCYLSYYPNNYSNVMLG